MIVRLHTLPLGLLAIVSAHLVVASNSNNDGGFDSLKNSDGKTPCDLTEDIEQCLTLSRQARALLSRYSLDRTQHFQGRDHDPNPSNCTCNNVFFNVWSACLISESNSARPADQWTKECADGGLSISEARDDGYNIPSWAFTSIPTGSATFDIDRAINEATSQADRWSKYQVVTTIAIVCSFVGVLAIFIFLYRWRRLWIRQHGLTHTPRSFRLPRMPNISFLSHNSRRKIQRSTDENFVIDRDVEELEENYEFVGPANSRSRNGHIRLPSSPIPHTVPRSQPSTLQNLVPAFRRIVRRIPLPWLRRPVAVRELGADLIFDIDGPNQQHRSRSDSTLQNYRTAFRPNYAPRVPPSTSNQSRSEPVIEEELLSDSDEEFNIRPASFATGNETDRLINNVYPSRNSTEDVMLISRSGNNFTIESGETTRLTPHAETSAPTQPRSSSRPRAPPAPQYPAPMPPASPRQAHSRQPSDNTFGTPSHSYSTPQSSSSPSRPSHRPLPGFDDNMLGLTGVHRGDPSSSSSTLDTPSPLYVRRPSNEAFRSNPNPLSTSNFRVPPHPLPIPTERISGYSSDFQIPVISSPPYHPSPLHDERILVPLRETPPPQLTPLYDRQFPRNNPSEIIGSSSRNDQAMLFSGPVRASGYLGSPRS